MDVKTSKKSILILIFIGIALIAGIWIWKEMQLRSLQKETDKHSTEIKKQYAQLMLEMQSQDLRAIIKPLVWAVRAEMLKNNLNDINFYINELVKEQGFQFIVITDDKNLIISSTNKKWEGKPFETVGLTSDLSSDSTIVKTVSNTILASAPIMGFNKRLGTVFISFDVVPLIFK